MALINTFVQQIKKQFATSFFLAFMPILTFAQGFEADVTSTVKVWEDLTGNNTLFIRVDAACNNYDMKRMFPKIGQQTAVIAKLTNDEKITTAFYEHKKFASQMLMFYDEGIWFKELDGIQAVFIPLFYCSSQHGEVMPLSYIVFYDNKQYIYHFSFKCKPTVFGTCELNSTKKLLTSKLHGLPNELRKELISYIEKVYTTREDLFPNHVTFSGDKYKRKELTELGTANDNSYPYVLLTKAHDYLENADLIMASVYLDEFKQLYINDEGVVDIAGFKNRGTTNEASIPGLKSQFARDEAGYLKDSQQAIDANLYEKSYWMLRAALAQYLSE